jgi:predicted alpha/beta-fold hydrolase
MATELPFEPFYLFPNPHQQTIMSSVLKFQSIPKSETKFVQLPNGDKLAAEITTPAGWKETDLTVLMVHGLCGCHNSPYMIRMTNRLEPQGIRVIRFNMRNCGSGKGLSKSFTHCGRSDDIFDVLKVIKEEHSDSPIVLAGFSMGGNLVLKLLGELGTLGHEYVKGAIVVCPPADLRASQQLFTQEQNRFYDRYFSRLLRDGVYELYRQFPDLPKIHLPKNMRLYEFDQMYLAPTFGFKSAYDYYDKCSAAPYVENISVPTRILFSKDDPIIAHTSLDSYDLPSHIEIFKTERGGHMGYLGSLSNPHGFYWLDTLVTTWIQEI